MMTSYRPIAFALLLGVWTLISQPSSTHAQLAAGPGQQCSPDTSGCRPHLDILWQGRRSGLLVRYAPAVPDRIPVRDARAASAASLPGEFARRLLRGASLMHRFTLWRGTWAGWSLAMHSLAGIGANAPTETLRGLSRARADTALEWELARVGRDGRPYISAVLGLGVQFALTREPDTFSSLRGLSQSIALDFQPSASIRIAPLALLREIW